MANQEPLHQRYLIILDPQKDGGVASAQETTSARNPRRHQTLTADRLQERIGVVVLDDRDDELHRPLPSIKPHRFHAIVNIPTRIAAAFLSDGCCDSLTNT